MNDTKRKIGLVGARGHTGRELLRIIASHQGLDLTFAGSREFSGKLVSEIAPEIKGPIAFETSTPDEIAAKDLDVIILALPDGVAAPYVEAIERLSQDALLVDLSADYRFDDQWSYGLPELLRQKDKGQILSKTKRIANPGCYATAMQLALYPAHEFIDGVPSIFGVSGFSGAGTTPSEKNDPARLEHNLMPYKLTGHNHEKEATRHLGFPVRFTPHVHPAFRGIVVTVHVPLKGIKSAFDLRALFEHAYGDEKLIAISDKIPELREGTGNNGVIIGGFEISEDGHHGVIVAAEDNLLKGAAVQAVQNINLALGFDEFTGIV